MKPLTSEERLLKIIRKKDNPLYPEGESKASNKSRNEEKESSSNFIGLINSLLILVSIAAIGWLGYKYYVGQEQAALLPAEKTQIKIQITDFETSILEEKSFHNDYKDVIEQRDIFQAPWEVEKPVEVKQPIEQLPDLSKKLKLVGVLLDENPTAIIEDMKKRKTTFMSVGDSIDGAVLQGIEEGKVIFIYRDERIEIVQ